MEQSTINPAVATIKGTLWRALSHFSGKMMVFITTVVLARLLSKVDFGIAGYAIVTIGFLDVMSDLGIGMAVIYFRERPERTNTAFWLNIVIGFVLCFLTWLIAPLAALFFHDPRAIPVIRILALAFPIDALSNIHDSLLQKDLAFGKKIIPDFVRSTSKGIISISLALLGFGAWSLIYGQIFGMAIAVMAYWWVHPFRPRLRVDTTSIRGLLRYGTGIVITKDRKSVV